ncbi:hypothetical protein A3D77_01555 [Candidatus Gottesmanbacteria bacterium RIFCSPHIGHO2_02_FULL_39_11]|uniref:Uncharacterized protein n=1 Tax=Candidatus Gottesmanbacteria bacterium RIFCSPHIGHO2_02_FULL_39_11 TaxID=1798382 RepID=A0A1F5ZTP3_9BACT|nr:MAG: hypothetical protein A3D77_01555 [Candidatus Gottesmanbacteria bacterium RIFCSPHIGHO2_02_FULL_39_11]
MSKYLNIIISALIIIFFVGLVHLIGIPKAFAQTPAGPNTQGIGCGGGMGPIGNIICGILNSNNTTDQNTQVANSLNQLVSGIISFITIIAGLWFLIQFIIGGFQWISAGADKGLLEIARLRMLHAVIGLLIVVVSYIFVGLVGNIFGLNIFNPGEAIIKLVI